MLSLTVVRHASTLARLTLLSALALPLSAQSATSFEILRDTASASGDLLAPGDFNRDGITDFISGTSARNLAIWIGNSDGTFRAPATIAPLSQKIQDLVIADFDHDGRLDFAFIQSDLGISPFFGKGDGTFVAGTPVVLGSEVYPFSLAAGDFNHDGLPDLAVGLPGGTVRLFNNTGGRNFVSASTLTIAPPDDVLSVRSGDIDGNGTIDLAVSTAKAAFVLWGSGTGSFTRTLLKSYHSELGVTATVGDLNQDGRPDILIANDCSYEQPGNGGAYCTTIDAFYGGQGTQKTLYRNLATEIPAVFGLIPADINGDGLSDLVAGRGNGIVVFLGKPDGSFNLTPERYLITSNGLGLPAIADINRDGRMDILMPGNNFANIQLLVNATPRAACATSTVSPTINVCAPVNGTYARTPVNFQATTFDTTHVSSIVLYQDGQKVSSQPVQSLNATLNVPLGSHNFTIKAFDASGRSFRSDRTLQVVSGPVNTVCPTAPGAATLCEPTTSAHSTSVHILPNGNTASLPTAAQLYVDGSLLINETNGVSALDRNISLTHGPHALTFKLWDDTGHTVSTSRTVTVN